VCISLTVSFYNGSIVSHLEEMVNKCESKAFLKEINNCCNGGFLAKAG
jgi:hypothetical protein